MLKDKQDDNDYQKPASENVGGYVLRPQKRDQFHFNFPENWQKNNEPVQAEENDFFP